MISLLLVQQRQTQHLFCEYSLQMLSNKLEKVQSGNSARMGEIHQILSLANSNNVSVSGNSARLGEVRLAL